MVLWKDIGLFTTETESKKKEGSLDNGNANGSGLFMTITLRRYKKDHLQTALKRGSGSLGLMMGD